MDQICRDSIISEDYSDFIVEYRKNISTLESFPNSCYNAIDDNYAVVYTPTVNVSVTDLLHTYGYGIFPGLFGLMDVGSLEASGVTRVRNVPNLALLGEGVLIGIVDTGIDYTHEAFRNADGTTRITSIWDQTIPAGPYPDTYYYGTEYSREQINEALRSENPHSIVPTVDELGHGTFLAGIAAGTPNLANEFSGVAPLSELVVVKLKQAKQNIREVFRVPSDAVCYQENDIMFGVRYLADMARKLDRPIAICIGLGSSQGSHDGRVPLSIFISNLADQPGVAITVAAGNEGNSGHHFQGLISRGGEQSNMVELKVGPNIKGFSMQLWGNAPGTFSIDILSPTGEYIPRIPARIGESREIRFIFEETVIHVDYFLLETQTGDQLILINFDNPTEGIWRFKVYSTGDLNAEFHIWLPITAFIGTETFFVQPTPNVTVTSPGNAAIPIVVTAYDYTNNSLYLQAGRGFTRVGAVTPSLAAPGVNLTGPEPGGTYGKRTGTSGAAAHAAGITAMLLQWGKQSGYYSQLDSVEMKNLLIRGAKRDSNNTYPNTEWGYGIIDIYNTFISLRGEPG